MGKVEDSWEKLYQVERKEKYCIEWKATKVHVHAQSFSTSFPAWEDLLKFDTTAWKLSLKYALYMH